MRTRRVLAAAVAVALVTPAQALAIDPPCEITGQVLADLDCTQEEWDAVYWLLWGEHNPNAVHSVLAIACPAVNSTLPGWSTPAPESGSAECLVQGATATTAWSVDHGSTRNTLLFEYEGSSTSSSGWGTFEMRHTFYPLRVNGTYARIGATWSFTGVQEFSYEGYPLVMTGPFVATGHGMPVTQGWPLVITAV